MSGASGARMGVRVRRWCGRFGRVASRGPAGIRVETGGDGNAYR